MDIEHHDEPADKSYGDIIVGSNAHILLGSRQTINKYPSVQCRRVRLCVLKRTKIMPSLGFAREDYPIAYPDT